MMWHTPSYPPLKMKRSLEEALAQFERTTDRILLRTEPSNPSPERIFLDEAMARLANTQSQFMLEATIDVQNPSSQLQNSDIQNCEMDNMFPIRHQDNLPYTTEVNKEGEEYWDVSLLSDEERETVLWIKQLMKDEQKVSTQTPLVENREDQENVQPNFSQEPSRGVSYPHLLQNSRPTSNIMEDDTGISLHKYEVEDYELVDCSLKHYMVENEGLLEDVDKSIHLDFIIPHIENDRNISFTQRELFLVIGHPLNNKNNSLDPMSDYAYYTYLWGSPTLLEHTKTWHDKHLFLDPS
ncbi:hypothetical protein Pfo_009242 [Paulownia fortunei]|nr:hypothetical protein Pfo_009242 [Paulownia fortunei]